MLRLRHLRRLRVFVPALAGVLLLTLLGRPDPGGEVVTEPVRPVTSGNPLAAGPWGVYTGPVDGIYPAYLDALGITRTHLSKIALRPRVRWFGSWNPTDRVVETIGKYIANVQNGDEDALVQLAIFRIWPRGEADRLPLSEADQTAYKAWIEQAARAIGDHRVAVVLEPDLPVALNRTAPELRIKMTRYAARRLSQLPRTTVYIDAGDADWLSVPRAVDLLRRAGVRYARGFSLGATHYYSPRSNIEYAAAVSRGLRAVDLPGKRAVLDTADNGRPFTWGQYWAKHPNGDFDTAEACRTTEETRCVRLGIPPTTDVAADRWGFPDAVDAQARRYVDAFLWFGRPWLYKQASPFLLTRALQIAAMSRWPAP